MRDSAIAIALLAVLMLGGHTLLRRRRSRSAPAHVSASDGSFTLRTPRRNPVLLGVSALVPAALVGVLTARAWTLGRTGTAGLVGGVLVTVLALLAPAYLFASAFRSKVVVHDTGIERVGVFRRKLIGWGSVHKIAFNPAQHWFFVTAADGSHLWLPADHAGMGDFAAIALRRLPPGLLREADPVVREVLEELADAVRTEPRRA